MSDALTDVISLLRPQTVHAKVISGRGKWAVRYASHEHPGFCLMLEGVCFLEPEGMGQFELRAGDFIFLPAIPSFTMGSEPGLRPACPAVAPASSTSRPSSPSPSPSRSIGLKELRHGTRSGKATMRQLGGFFCFERANAALLLKFLPSLILIRRGDLGASRVRRIVKLIAEEAALELPGRDVILERLAELLLVEALRFRPASAMVHQPRGLLSGLADPALARAIERMHQDVARRWTVEALARSAGMSRAVFAERFHRKVGLPPMEYLSEWRMAVAKDILHRGPVPLADLAERIGYQSASAFSAAFTRHVGASPSAFARGLGVGRGVDDGRRVDVSARAAD